MSYQNTLNDWYLIGLLKFLKVEHTNLKIWVCLKLSHLLKYRFPQHPFWLSGPVMGELWSEQTLLRDILDQRMHIKCFLFVAKSTPTQRIHSWATHLTFCVTICFTQRPCSCPLLLRTARIISSILSWSIGLGEIFKVKIITRLTCIPMWN